MNARCLCCHGPLIADDIWKGYRKCLHCGRSISPNDRYGDMVRDAKARRKTLGGWP